MQLLASSPIILVMCIIAYWLFIALISGMSGGKLKIPCPLIFGASSLGSICLIIIAVLALYHTRISTIVLPLGLPGLHCHFYLDPLASFFLILLGCGALGVTVFSMGYFQHLAERTRALLSLQVHIFLASIALVFLAADAYSFMVVWEVMALSSYFLIITEHYQVETRRAGFLYLLIAHLGALAILTSFGLILSGANDLTFVALRTAHLSQTTASIAFLLALIGFGAKAGVIPLHIWLPEAHPAAPSPISALLSGVMLKAAIYGLLRVTVDLLGTQQLWWWGAIILVLGLIGTLFGIIFAAVQVDMKRLLAYSSIENIGIILAGVGLSIVFHVFNQNVLATLALVAALYHCLNHTFFKSLLFLGAGSVLYATGQRCLDKLGGLLSRMPIASFLMLIGILAAAGLPPFNGFVSEWLLLQAFIFFPQLPTAMLTMFIPVAAAVIALAAALAAYVMVKFYGIVFLGQSRLAKQHPIVDVHHYEWLGLGWFASGCVLLGILPTFVVAQLNRVTASLNYGNIAQLTHQYGWTFLTPIAPERASYNPLLFLLVISCVIGLSFVAIRYLYHVRMRRGPAWDCGFVDITPKMQDSAEGFGQPIMHIFSRFFRSITKLPSPFDQHPVYFKQLDDPWWYSLYLPLTRWVLSWSFMVTQLQRGKINIYLLYSFLTLLGLLFLVQFIT